MVIFKCLVSNFGPANWAASLQRGKTSSTRVLNMTLKNLMVRLNGRVLTLHSVVAGLIFSGGDHSIHC